MYGSPGKLLHCQTRELFLATTTSVIVLVTDSLFTTGTRINQSDLQIHINTTLGCV